MVSRRDQLTRALQTAATMVVAADVSLPKDFSVVESKVQRPGTAAYLQAAVEHVSSGAGDVAQRILANAGLRGSAHPRFGS